MIETHSINVFAPQLSAVKDPTAGYFAAVNLADFSKESLAASATYSRKDFFKISLITGNASYHYGGKVVHLQPGEWMLIFTNGEQPYHWDTHDGKCIGFSCMFTADFLPLHTHLRPADWAVFNGSASSVFKLTENDKAFFEGLFKKMINEQASTYEHKYELLFIYVLECIHGALKLQPEPEVHLQNAASQLTKSFKALLASQFPLAYPHQELSLRTAQQFAEKLSVHVNYLNRALKEVTGKTTTQLITERFMQEAQALLVHSNWSISQISQVFGFDEPTHFARAFRNYSGHTPSSLRAGSK
jgi:AraC family transcriptional regulator, transcriptional activator of pobA